MNFEEEVKIIQNKISNNPSSINLINDLAIALMETNQYEEALLQFENAAKIKPNIQSLHNLAYFYCSEGVPMGDGCWQINDRNAIRLLESVLQLKPLSHFPYSLLGEIYTSKKNFDKAISLLLKAVSMEPTLQNLNNLGVCYYNQSKWSQAAECFKKAYEKRKDNTELHPLLGYGICLAKLDKSEEALKVANKLISQNQKIESTIDQLEDEIAYIYFLTDHFSDFVAIYSKLNLNNYSVEWLPPYFYSLLKSVGVNMLEKASEKLIRHKEKEMQETLEENDAEWEPGRRLEYINELKSDIDLIKITVREISSGKKPKLNFDPNIETECYLFGCKRHKNPIYTRI